MKSQITKLLSVFACICLLLTAIIIPASAAETSATITFDSKDKRTTYTDTQQVWEEAGIKLINNKGTYNNKLGDYAKPVRLYAGTETIIEFAGMTKIVFDANNNTYATDLKNSCTTGTVTVSSDKVTVEFDAPVDSYTIASMTKQVRLDALTVYATVAEEEPEECKHIGGYASSNGDETHNIICDSCEEVLQENIACTDADADGKCDECLGEVAVETPETPDEPSTPATSATITFDSSDKATWSSTQQVWTENGITVTNNKAASTTNIDTSKKYSNPARFYKSSEVIIEYPGMTKIVIDSVTYSDNDYAGAWVNSFDTTLGTATATDGDVTIVLNSAVDSLTFSKMAAQARAYSITVYTGETGGTTPDEPDTPDVPDTPENNDPAADSTLTIAEAIALGASKDHNTYTEGKYYVSGVITEVYNDMYGNMKITDDAGNILTVYGTYSADGADRYDAMATKPVAGDTVKIYGIIGQYNGTAQIKNGWIVEHTPATTPENPDPEIPENNDPAADSTLTIAEAIALGASKAHNTYTEGKYYVSGVITEVYNDMYGNMKITDDAGNILTVYGTYSADGADRYDAMATKPVAGDTVKIYGIIGQYNGTAQIKNGWIVEHTPATTPENPDTPDEPDVPVEPDVPSIPAPDATNTLTIKEALELGAAQDTSSYTADKYYVTGKLTALTSDVYGNMYLADEEGNEILVYGTYGADGKDRYDALESKPDEGDTVTVYGVVGNYNGTPQLKNAWIIEFTAGELEEPEVKDPAADSKLTIEEAIALALSKRHNVFTADKYYVTGKIIEIYNEDYGNMKIQDAAGNILTIYGSYSEDGSLGFAEMETKPAVGDTVTFYGIIGQYNGTAQMKNAWMSLSTTDDNNTNEGEGEGNGETTTPDAGTGDNTGDNGTTSPVTGDSVGAVVTMALAAAAVIVYTKKKR